MKKLLHRFREFKEKCRRNLIRKLGGFRHPATGQRSYYHQINDCCTNKTLLQSYI